MKSAEESNDVQTDVMPVEEVKVENDNEGKEVSEGFDNLLPEHCFVDPTKLEENSDRDDCHSTSENESQVYPIFLLNVTDYCHFCLRFFPWAATCAVVYVQKALNPLSKNSSLEKCTQQKIL